jgi:hypothetical protein
MLPPVAEINFVNKLSNHFYPKGILVILSWLKDKITYISRYKKIYVYVSVITIVSVRSI